MALAHFANDTVLDQRGGAARACYNGVFLDPETGPQWLRTLLLLLLLLFLLFLLLSDFPFTKALSFLNLS